MHSPVEYVFICVIDDIAHAPTIMSRISLFFTIIFHYIVSKVNHLPNVYLLLLQPNRAVHTIRVAEAQGLGERCSKGEYSSPLRSCLAFFWGFLIFGDINNLLTHCINPLNDLNHPEKATIDVNSKAAINVAYGEVPDLSKFVKTWRQEGFAVAGCDAPRPVR